MDERDESEQRGDPGITIELLRGAHAGDRDDLERLFLRVGPVVQTWAHARTKSDARTRVSAEDVSQEAWLRVLSKVESLSVVPDNFRGWLIGIAKNVLFEMTRKTQGQGRAAGPEEQEALDLEVDPATAVFLRVARGDALSAFLARVDRLGELERDLLVLHGLEGRSFVEIAERLDVSRDVAAKRWQRLRARLAHGGPTGLPARGLLNLLVQDNVSQGG